MQICEKEKLKDKISLGGSVGDWTAVLAIQRLLVQSHAHVEHEIDLKLCLIGYLRCTWPQVSLPLVLSETRQIIVCFMTEIRM